MKPKRWAAAIALAGLAGFVVLFGIVSVALTPPLSGQIVDAFSGKPLKGIDIGWISEFEQSYFEGSHEELHRTFHTTTDAQGRFKVPPSFKISFGVLRSYHGYRLVVNLDSNHPSGWYAALSPALLRDFPPQGDFPIAFSLNPWETPKTQTPEKGGTSTTWLSLRQTLSNPAYYPMNVVFGAKCYSPAGASDFNANCVDTGSRWMNLGVRIELIPVIEDLAECDRAVSAASKIRCVQLNAYRVAFRKHDASACEKLNDVSVLSECLKDLAPKNL